MKAISSSLSDLNVSPLPFYSYKTICNDHVVPSVILLRAWLSLHSPFNKGLMNILLNIIVIFVLVDLSVLLYSRGINIDKLYHKFYMLIVISTNLTTCLAFRRT